MKVPRGLGSACHEAAHAVVAVSLGISFKCIRLCRKRARLPQEISKLFATMGIVATCEGEFVPLRQNIPWRSKKALLKVQVDLAGLAFEKLLYPRKAYAELCFSGSCIGDYEMARFWLWVYLKRRETTVYPRSTEFQRRAWPILIKNAVAQGSKVGRGEVGWHRPRGQDPENSP